MLRICPTCGQPRDGKSWKLHEAESESVKRRNAIEVKAREIYEGWKDVPGWIPWVEHGNSHKQTDARQLAASTIARSAQKLMAEVPADTPTADDGKPIVYDTNAVDEVTHALTGDEGEDDSVTVLRRFAAYVENAWPGKTAMQVLIDLEESTASANHPLDALLPEICQLIDAVKADWSQQGCWSEWDQSVRDRIAAYNLSRLASSNAGVNTPDGEQR